MFEERYLIMQTISRKPHKQTSIVKSKQNSKYYIAKKVAINDSKTMHEINLMRNLHHPNIISLHQIIEEEQYAHIVEEYCEEGDLQYHLKRQIKIKKKINEDVVSRWMLQILLAIQHLHHAKIIHRDIRPKNIFLTSNGNIKLGSFKASKQLENEVSYAQTLINSPYYMTPELMEGKKYDCRVDMWAFGCVLYEVCCLKPLLNVVKLADLISKVSHGKVQELPPSYSKPLNNIYLKCMKRNPSERVMASQLLKTQYFLTVLEKFISDEGLNINLNAKIPIKRYNIHKHKYERLKIKRGLVKDRGAYSVQKKDNLLPKLELHLQNQKKNSHLRPNSREKGDKEKYQRQKIASYRGQKQPFVRTPVIKRSSLSKQGLGRGGSTEKKKIKTDAYYKSRQKEPKQFQLERLDNQRDHKMTLAPPLLPKPNKKIEKAQTPKTSKTSEPKGETDVFESTMSKESLSKQLAQFQRKDLKEINQGLNKMLSNWNISEQQEVQFQFQEENELRLTAKSTQQEADSLLKTAKKKLAQLIEEINYKYCPDMQPIAEKTQQFDSNSLSQFRLYKN